MTFPVLATVGGELSIAQHPSLEALAVPQLGDIGGAVTVQGNAALESLALPALGPSAQSITCRCADNPITPC